MNLREDELIQFILIMKVMKNQGKTWNSQQSDIDHFAKLQNSFLQKFFKNIITDLFELSLVNLSEKLAKTKINDRAAKSLSQDLFQISQNLPIQQFISTTRDFLKPKSPSFLEGQLQRIIELQYVNQPASLHLQLTAGELALFQVKIRLDIEKIEELPLLIQQRIQAVLKKGGECPVTQLFKGYKKENINFIIVYFGEYNFQLVRKHHFEKQEIFLFGQKYKLRIFTIFLSKLVLLQTFRNTNKIQHPECINDLTIQVYEMKRQRAKRKKQKKQAKAKKNQQDAKKQRLFHFLQKYGLKAVIGIAVVGIGMVILKKFFK